MKRDAVARQVSSLSFDDVLMTSYSGKFKQADKITDFSSDSVHLPVNPRLLFLVADSCVGSTILFNTKGGGNNKQGALKGLLVARVSLPGRKK